MGRCGFIFIYFFVFSKGRGHDGPFLNIGFILRLIFDQTGKVRLLYLVKPAKNVPFHQNIDDPLVKNSDILESSKRSRTEDLIPRD